MSEVTIFDDTGQARWVALPAGDEVQDIPVGWHSELGNYDGDLYYWDSEILPRPDNPAVADTLTVVANEVDTVTISGIPVGTAVVVNDSQAVTPSYDNPVTVNDGVFEVSFDLPDTYSIYLTLFPYKPKKFTIDAT